jgi:hypothetical protein
MFLTPKTNLQGRKAAPKEAISLAKTASWLGPTPVIVGLV